MDSFTGQTNINAGNLTIQSGMTNGNVDITEGATLTLNSLNNNTYAGLITGGGGLVMNSGSLYLTNDNTYTGGTTLKNSFQFL